MADERGAEVVWFEMSEPMELVALLRPVGSMYSQG